MMGDVHGREKGRVEGSEKKKRGGRGDEGRKKKEVTGGEGGEDQEEKKIEGGRSGKEAGRGEEKKREECDLEGGGGQG